MLHNIKKFFKTDAAPGLILILSGAIAMILSNSRFSDSYFTLINTKAPFNIIFIVNDILMTIFFLDIGLEIKHQIATGNLSNPKQIFLPTLAAIGGVIVPAAFFLGLNFNNPIANAGWAIPTATDTAFALGIIMILGRHVPLSLKILLLTVSVIDDVIALVIIAVFYAHSISALFLFLAAICIVLLLCLNYYNKYNLVHYIMLGILLWICVHSAGIHPAIAGVILGLCIPKAVHEKIHRKLYIWVSFVILPIFALVNAGIPLNNISWQQALDPLPLGIALGLFFGKQFGVYSFAWIGIKAKIAELPPHVSWSKLYGMSVLCGIGFTMSVFIGNLAYAAVGAEYMIFTKVGVLAGSLASAVLGYLILRFRR